MATYGQPVEVVALAAHPMSLTGLQLRVLPLAVATVCNIDVSAMAMVSTVVAGLQHRAVLLPAATTGLESMVCSIDVSALAMASSVVAGENA